MWSNEEFQNKVIEELFEKKRIGLSGGRYVGMYVSITYVRQYTHLQSKPWFVYLRQRIIFYKMFAGEHFSYCSYRIDHTKCY